MILTIGLSNGSCWIIKKSQKCLFEWSMEPKMGRLAFFWSLVCWVDLILHIVIGLNALQHSSALPDPERSFKNHKKDYFGMILRVKKQVFGRFKDFCQLNRLDVAYGISTKHFSTLSSVTRSWRMIRNRRNAFPNDPKSEKLGFWPSSGLQVVEPTWYCIIDILIVLNKVFT